MPLNPVKTLVRMLLPEKKRLQLWYAYFKLRGFFYRGNAVECPCCMGQFTKFLPYGEEKRPDAVCPSCHSLERHRLLWLYLERETAAFTQKLRVLHFAPEPVIQQRLRSQPNLDYISADLFSPLAMVKADIMALPFPDQSFDVILCSHVLAHVENDQKAMAELLRVLSPAGILLLQAQLVGHLATTLEVPEAQTPAQRLEAYGQDDRYRNYGLDYRNHVRKAGFQVDQINYSNSFSERERRKYGLVEQDFIFRCTKTIPQ